MENTAAVQRVQTNVSRLQPGDLLIGSGHRIVRVANSYYPPVNGKSEVVYTRKDGVTIRAHWGKSTTMTVERTPTDHREPEPGANPLAAEDPFARSAATAKHFGESDVTATLELAKDAPYGRDRRGKPLAEAIVFGEARYDGFGADDKIGIFE